MVLSDRLARLEALVSHLIKANKIEFGDLCLLPESKPPVPPSECEHEYWLRGFKVDHMTCKTCGYIKIIEQPTASDEPKCNDKDCGCKKTPPETYPYEPDYISISRKVAEEWIKTPSGQDDDETRALLKELRRAIGKGNRDRT
jgi:hypothetical protein